MRKTILSYLSAFFLIEGAEASALFLDRSFSVPDIYRLDGMAFNDTTGNLYGVTAAGRPDTLYEFTSEGALISSIGVDFLPGVGGSRSLAYDSGAGHLFLGNYTSDGHIYRFTTDGNLLGTIPVSGGGFFGAMTYNRFTDTLFMTRSLTESPTTIIEVNKSSGEVLNSFLMPEGSRGMGFNGRNLVMIVGAENNTILEMDPSTGRLMSSSASGIGRGDSAATFGGGEFFLWNDDENRLDVFVPEPSTTLFSFSALGLLLVRRR